MLVFICELDEDHITFYDPLILCNSVSVRTVSDIVSPLPVSKTNHLTPLWFHWLPPLGSLQGSTALCIMLCAQGINQMLHCWHHHVCLFTGVRWRDGMKEGGDQEQMRKVACWERWGKSVWNWSRKENKTACIHTSRISKFNLLCLPSLFSPQCLHWIIKHSQCALTGCLLSEPCCLVCGWGFN